MTDYTSKRCKICKESYPPTTEYWYKHRGYRDGLSALCKACHKARYLVPHDRLTYSWLDESWPTERGINSNFWNKVNLPDTIGTDECWEWLGQRSSAGYGQVNIDGKKWVASRYAYQLCIGPLDANKYICHTCDNPPCVNPAHLWQGTPLDNTMDMMRKGRNRHGPGYNNK